MTCFRNRFFGLEEVSKHNQQGDCWIVIKGNVYDVTRWCSFHPGGKLTILGVAGQDCTDAFTVLHSKEITKTMLPHYQIGMLDNWRLTALQRDFHEIIHQLEVEGKFQTSYRYYIHQTVWLTLLFSIIIALLFLPNSFQLHGLMEHGCFLVSSLLLGLFWQQVAFLGHDFGHNSVSGTQSGDFWGSLFVTILFGVSAQWWKRTHNVHHLHTNSINSDPDIQHLPFFAVDKAIFKGFWSTYYQKLFEFNKIAQCLVSYQHLLYYAIMSVARVNLYVQSFLTVFNRSLHVPNRWIELSALLLYWLWFLLLLSLVPSGWSRCYYFLCSHLVCGLLHVQITLSHFAMPTYLGLRTEGAKSDRDAPGDSEIDSRQDSFLLNQFQSTMNVSCDPVLDWLHGGLQFQIEHHLFPRLPRHNLRYVAEKYIKPLAEKYRIHYHCYSFFTGNRMVYQNLKQQAMLARLLYQGS